MRQDDLADRIYEASVLPELWTGVIAQIANSVDGEAALLSTVQMNTVRMVSTSVDLPRPGSSSSSDSLARRTRARNDCWPPGIRVS